MRRLNLEAFCLLLAFTWCSPMAFSQAVDPTDPDPGISPDNLQRLAAEAAAGNALSPLAPDSDGLSRGSINFLNLLVEGGVLMIPIALMSLLVVAFSIERAFAIRRSRVFPRRLRKAVSQMADPAQLLAPQELFEVASNSASPAGRVMQDALQKLGRPLPEVEAVMPEVFDAIHGTFGAHGYEVTPRKRDDKAAA